MGRSKKFSFPLPGRKPGYAKSKRESEDARVNGSTLSKAQRFFGTESDLNIDSPTRYDDGTWHSRELGPMSIALSETTEDWDGMDDDDESGVLPTRVLYGKASSTLLGRDYRGSVESRTSRDLQSERSSSTLKSYYDRQKTPLAVSQQTSASSVRDLALRKGQPVVTSPRSPLMRIDFPGVTELRPTEKGKKKPTRLDLSRLTSRSRREDVADEVVMLSPDTYNPRQSTALRSPSLLEQVEDPKTPTKPTKANRKLDFKRDSRPISTATHIAQLMIEPKIPPRKRLSEQRQQITLDASGQWKDSQQWDNISTASKSSLNTKSSKRSVVSVSDLRTTSVLSLSSDEDTEEEIKSPPREREPARPIPKPRRLLSQIDEHPHDFLALPAQEGCILAIPAQDGNFLTIPLPVPGSSRLSGPWAQPTGDVPRRTSVSSIRLQRSPEISQEPTPPLSPPSSLELPDAPDQSSRLMAVTKQEEALLEALRQKRARMREKIIAEHETTKSPSRYDADIALRAVTTLVAPFKEQKIGSVQEQTPLGPLMEPSPGRSSKEQTPLGPKKEQRASGPVQEHIPVVIIREQTVLEPTKEQTPLGLPFKEQSPTKAKERILLYLDRPLAETHPIDTAEPSPDLSDFISFGSSDDDGDFGPPSSWIPSKDHPRPDSMVSPTSGSRTPLSPHSAARLSAVGAGSFPQARHRKSEKSYMSSTRNANGSREILYEEGM